MNPLGTIRAAIERRGWTAAELQRQSGISYRAAWTVIHGDSESISWTNLGRLLTALDLDISDGHG